MPRAHFGHKPPELSALFEVRDQLGVEGQAGLRHGNGIGSLDRVSQVLFRWVKGHATVHYRDESVYRICHRHVDISILCLNRPFFEINSDACTCWKLEVHTMTPAGSRLERVLISVPGLRKIDQ